MSASPVAVLGLALLVGYCLSADAEQRPVVIGIITDPQYHPGPPKGTRYYAHTPSKLREAVSVLNGHRPDFTVNLGDAVDKDFDSFAGVLTLFQELESPVFHVAGNHDFDVEEGRRVEVRDLLKPNGIKSVHGYYSWTGGGWRFIVLNGYELNAFLPGGHPLCEEANRLFSGLILKLKQNANPWNGGVSREQMDFLDRELRESDHSGQNSLVFCHFPVWPESGLNLWNDVEVLRILGRRSSVRAFFSGHKHEGGYGIKDGIHHVSFKGMVETPAENAFALVTLTGKEIVIEGFGREDSRRLPFRPRE